MKDTLWCLFLGGILTGFLYWAMKIDNKNYMEHPYTYVDTNYVRSAAIDDKISKMMNSQFAGDAEVGATGVFKEINDWAKESFLDGEYLYSRRYNLKQDINGWTYVATMGYRDYYRKN